MSWIDDDDYFGPDRRRARRLRLFDRRHHDTAHEPPSLGALLRKLQHWASNVAGEGIDGIARYRARVQTVAKLAGERGEPGVEAWLSELDRELEHAQTGKGYDVATITNRCLQSAMATLR
jgi:hypothetical protein